MLIGVMSDTHDNLTNTRLAVAIFNKCNVSRVIHAGDFTSCFMFDALKDLKAEFSGIFGNNDFDLSRLDKEYREKLHIQPYEFVIEQKRFVMIHEHFNITRLTQTGSYDFLIYGHTHKPKVEQTGRTVVLNPGETCGWLHGNPTVALLDTTTAETHFIKLA
ncbi:MAG: metallophosphoesterase [Candidatus Magnetobacterium sp. LHC-1]|nr:metallophosphoesterase [Nitrospirota bacterium]